MAWSTRSAPNVSGNVLYLEHFVQGSERNTDIGPAINRAVAAYAAGNRAGYITCLDYPGEKVPILTQPIINTPGVQMYFPGWANRNPTVEFAVGPGVSGMIIGQFGADTRIVGACFTQPTRNTNTQTGSYTPDGGGGIVTLSAAGDFVNDQIIKIPGCGGASTMAPDSQPITADVNGTTTVTINGFAQGELHGIFVGQWIRLVGVTWGGASKVRVTAITPPGGMDTSFTITVSTAADSSATGKEVYWVSDIFTRIVSGGGTTTLRVEKVTGEAGTGLTISHADCGVYMSGRSDLDVTVGGDPNNEYFAGPALIISGHNSSHPSPGTNVNMGKVYARLVHGAGGALYVDGTDANVCQIFANCTPNTVVNSWAVVDNVGLGSNFTTIHCAGGYGYFGVGNGSSTTASQVQSSNLGCLYVEGGTRSILSPKSLAMIIGSSGIDYGGTSFNGIDAAWNKLDVGLPGAANQIRFNGVSGERRRGVSSVSGSIDLTDRFHSDPNRFSSGNVKGQYVGEWPGGSHAFAALLTTAQANWRTFSTPAQAGGAFIHHRGLFYGGDPAGGTLDVLAKMRYRGFDSAPPSAGVMAFQAGDIIDNNRATAANDWIDHWVCITGGDPGTWVAVAGTPAEQIVGDATSVTLALATPFVAFTVDLTATCTCNAPALSAVPDTFEFVFFDMTGANGDTINVAPNGSDKINLVNSTQLLFTTSTTPSRRVLRKINDSVGWFLG